ncbi:hypothetical protein [Embleya hyalina]|nr:hypothetical protein [Embleya hyalina]
MLETAGNFQGDPMIERLHRWTCYWIELLQRHDATAENTGS